MSDHETITEFAQNYAKAWCSQDPDRVASFFSEDGSLSINGGEPSIGRAAIAKAAQNFMAAFPDMTVSFDAIIDTAIGKQFHWTLRGSNTGPGGSGNRIEISGYEVWQIAPDGSIARSSGYFDTVEYARQLEQDAK